MIASTVLLFVAMPARADDKEDLIAKWELTEAAAGMPAGTIWEFKKGGILGVIAQANGKEIKLEFKYELKEKILHLDVNGKKDTTGLQKLTKEELVLKDNDGTMAKFKKIK